MPESQCWCGRWWVIKDFIDQCARGDHLPPKPPKEAP